MGDVTAVPSARSCPQQMPLLPHWLAAAKHHLSHRSPAIARLRVVAAAELRARLQDSGRLHAGGLAAIAPKERETLIRAICDALRDQESPLVSRSGLAGNMASVWLEARADIERVIDERLSVAVWAGQLNNGDSMASGNQVETTPSYNSDDHGNRLDPADGSDSIPLRKQLLQLESERGAVSLLCRWPESWRSIRGCLNMPLQRNLRRATWRAALRDEKVASDFMTYLKSERLGNMAAVYSPAIYDLSQAYLSSNPMLLPLATQYRCVKRMEQVLMYLLSPDSVPSLRTFRLGFSPLPVDNSMKQAGSGAQAIAGQFGGTCGLALSPQFSESLLESDRQSGGGSTARSRQLAVIVPFLKVLELDAAETSVMGGCADMNPMNASTLPGMVAPALESVDGSVWRAGRKGLGATRNADAECTTRKTVDDEVFYWMDGVRASREETRTARMVEVVAKFWALMPDHWRRPGEYVVQIFYADVETYLQQEDFALYTHLTKIIGEASVGHDFSGFAPLIRNILGDLFVGKCTLDVLAYIFDQLIIGSFESTQDSEFPPFDTIICWFCSAFLFAMRTNLLQCTTAKNLMQLVAQIQPTISLHTLQSLVEAHFASRFRRAVPTAHMESQLFGLGRPTTAERLAAVRAVERYKSRMRFARGDDPDVDNEWHEEDYKLLDEQDLIDAEADYGRPYSAWAANKRQKDGRRAKLMRAWRRVARSAGKWILYFHAHRAEAERKKEQLARAAEKMMHSTKAMPPSRVATPPPPVLEQTPVYPVFPLPEPSMMEPEPEPVAESVKTTGSDDVSFFVSPFHEDPIAQKPATLSLHIITNMVQWANRAPMWTGSILVQPLTPLGEEMIHLSPLGSLMVEIFKKTQYILEGSTSLAPGVAVQYCHAFNFQRQLQRDVESSLQSATNRTSLFTITSKKASRKKSRRVGKEADENVEEKSKGTELTEASPTSPSSPSSPLSPASPNTMAVVASPAFSYAQFLDGMPKAKREKVLAAVEKLRLARREEVLEDEDTPPYMQEMLKDESKVEEDRRAGIDFAKRIMERQMKPVQVRTINGIMGLVIDKMMTVFHGDEEYRESMRVASVYSESGLLDDEREAWYTVFADSIPYSHEAAMRIAANTSIPTLGTGAAHATVLRGGGGAPSEGNDAKESQVGLSDGNMAEKKNGKKIREMFLREVENLRKRRYRKKKDNII